MWLVAVMQRTKQIKQKVLFLSLPDNKRHLAHETSVVSTQCLVVDGEGSDATPIPRPPADALAGDKHPWVCLSIAGGYLHIFDCADPHRSVSVVTPSGPHPPSFVCQGMTHSIAW